MGLCFLDKIIFVLSSFFSYTPNLFIHLYHDIFRPPTNRTDSHCPRRRVIYDTHPDTIRFDPTPARRTRSPRCCADGYRQDRSILYTYPPEDGVHRSHSCQVSCTPYPHPYTHSYSRTRTPDRRERQELWEKSPLPFSSHIWWSWSARSGRCPQKVSRYRYRDTWTTPRSDGAATR